MRVTLIAAALAILPVMSLAQNPAGIDLSAAARESEPAAKASLSTLAKLATGDNARRLGFSAPGDAQSTKLSTPLSDFIIGLDSIRAWQAGIEPLSLLRRTDLIVYPVQVAGEVRSSVTLKKEVGGWRAVEFGAPALSVAVAGTRHRVLENARVTASDIFQVRIPAFNLVFLGHVADRHLILTPAVESQRYELAAGVPVEASVVLGRLKPDAERDQGLPR